MIQNHEHHDDTESWEDDSSIFEIKAGPQTKDFYEPGRKRAIKPFWNVNVFTFLCTSLCMGLSYSILPELGQEHLEPRVITSHSFPSQTLMFLRAVAPVLLHLSFSSFLCLLNLALVLPALPCRAVSFPLSFGLFLNNTEGTASPFISLWEYLW